MHFQRHLSALEWEGPGNAWRESAGEWVTRAMRVGAGARGASRLAVGVQASAGVRRTGEREVGRDDLGPQWGRGQGPFCNRYLFWGQVGFAKLGFGSDAGRPNLTG